MTREQLEVWFYALSPLEIEGCQPEMDTETGGLTLFHYPEDTTIYAQIALDEMGWMRCMWYRKLEGDEIDILVNRVATEKEVVGIWRINGYEVRIIDDHEDNPKDANNALMDEDLTKNKKLH